RIRKFRHLQNATSLVDVTEPITKVMDSVKADIEFVAVRGLLFGTDKTTFSPNAPMPREVFAAALGRLAGIDPSSYKKAHFKLSISLRCAFYDHVIFFFYTVKIFPDIFLSDYLIASDRIEFIISVS
ncbi:MAG: hypothetical protein RR444_12295, partial [Oscillospiraceae bacterium]